MSRAACMVISCLALAACGSNPVEEHYYSLVLAADDVTAPLSTDAASPHLIVGPVQLPEYLMRRGIAMQLDANEIRTANHHFWAEPLEEAISKVLVRDLADLANGLAVDREAGRWTDSVDCSLRIEFDKFHATDRSHVVASGRYWLADADSQVKQEFDVTETLVADGYAHAVAALRQSLRTISMQIADTIRSRAQCTAGASSGSGLKLTGGLAAE